MANEKQLKEEEFHEIADLALHQGFARGLSKEQIDMFWFKCGWIDAERGENKALPQWRLDKIKSDKDSAYDHVYRLLMESYIEEVKKNLLEIESVNGNA